MPDRYCVAQFKGAKRVATISGLGRNHGKWESEHSKRTAEKYAREMNAARDGYTYKVESNY